MILINQYSYGCKEYNSRNQLSLRGLALKEWHKTINHEDNHHKVDYIKCHSLNTFWLWINKLISKVSQSKTILVEWHPEEDNDSKNKTKSNNTLLSLLWSKFFLSTSRVSFLALTCTCLNMLKGAAERIINHHWHDQWHTSNCKREVVSIITRITKRMLCPFLNSHSCCRSKECTNVDCHVEDRETWIALCWQLWCIIKITHHHL